METMTNEDKVMNQYLMYPYLQLTSNTSISLYIKVCTESYIGLDFPENFGPYLK